MILVDTGALYALGDRRDTHHAEAVAFFRKAHPAGGFVLPLTVLVEAALLIEARLGMRPVRALWDDVGAGIFELLPVGDQTIALARQIDRRYTDLNLGLVDATCLALCEERRIGTVFTYDRRDFGAYRPTFAPALTLVP